MPTSPRRSGTPPSALPARSRGASSQVRSTPTRRTARRRRRAENGTRSGTAPDSPFTVFETPGAMLEASRQWRREGLTIGLVPTMGALHAGHLSLTAEARRENAIVIVSVFVNPIQFGAGEDFERYPRDPARDVDMLGRAGVDAEYRPSVAVMYPPGSSTRVHVGGVGEPLEGAARPGHFEGVATVVSKLFAAVEP